MGHNVRAVLKGTAEEGRGKGIIHHQGHIVPVGNGCIPGNIENRQGRIRDGLTEHQTSVLVKQRFHLFVGHFVADVADLNSHPRHGDRQQIDGAAIDIVHGNQVLPGRADVEHRQQVRRLAGGNQHGTHAALQIRELFLHCRQGGIGDAGIHMSLRLQVKQLPKGIGIVILVGRALVNGQGAGFGIAGLVAGLNALGIKLIIGHLDCLQTE